MTYRGRLVAGRPPVIEGNAGSNPAPGLRTTSCSGGAVEGSAARVVVRSTSQYDSHGREGMAGSEPARRASAGRDTATSGDAPPPSKGPRIAHAFRRPDPEPGEQAVCGYVLKRGQRAITVTGTLDDVDCCAVCAVLCGEREL